MDIMRNFQLHFNNKTIPFLFIIFFILVNSSCQENEKKSVLRLLDIPNTAQLEPDSVSMLNIMQNEYYKLFTEVKSDLLFNSYDEITDFKNLSMLFHSDEKEIVLKKKSYYEDEIEASTYALLFNGNSLSRVLNLENNLVELHYEYDNSNNLEKITENHKYKDLIETDRNKIQTIKGGNGVTQTTYYYQNNIVSAISSNRKSRRVEKTQFLYFSKKDDPSLKIVKEIERKEVNEVLGVSSDFNYYVFKDAKLMKYAHYKADDSIPFSFFEFTYLSENNIEMDYYERDETGDFKMYTRVSIEIDDKFNVQNISVNRELNFETKIFETQFVYFYEDQHLKAFRVAKRNYSKGKEGNLPDYELDREFTRMN